MSPPHGSIFRASARRRRIRALVMAGALAFGPVSAQTIPAPAGAGAAARQNWSQAQDLPQAPAPARPGGGYLAPDFTPTGVIAAQAPFSGPASFPNAAPFPGAAAYQGAPVRAAAPGESAALPAEPSAPESVLRHLPNNIQGFRLNGEVGASEWPIYLSEAQTRHHLSFRVGYLSAVSVMPEASTLTVAINDVVIGTTPIRAPNKVQSVEFDVPPNLVKPGFNAVRIAVDQRHRVDCSLKATYELWTQIDPTQTGLVMPSNDSGAQELTDLPALPPDGQGALPVRAVLPGRTSAANIERVIRAVQFISSVGHFEQPVVDVGPMAAGDYGVNLVVGLYADVAQMADLSGLGPVERSRLALLPATATRRTTIVITGQTEEDVNRALASFGEAAAPHGSEAGLRAANAFPGYRVSGGQTVRLRDLGVRSQEFSGRYFRTGFNIIMPADFYSADYAKVPLDLAGGYAPGLLSSAQIIVSINGRNAVSSSLPRSQGDVFKENTLPLPLGYFRPGLNRIEIEAQLPAVEDAACDPLAAIAGKKRFLFLDSTQIRIPDLARIGRMPDLAVTATGGFPFIGGSKQPKLYMPSPDRDSIAAAATLAGRMAASAGRPIDFRFTVTPPPVGSGATLVMTNARNLDDATASAVGLDPSMLRKIWGNRIDEPASQPDSKLSPFDMRARNRLVLQKNLPAACHLSRRSPANGDGASLAAKSVREPAPEREISDDAFAAAAPPQPPFVAAPESDLYAEWSNAHANHWALRKWAGDTAVKLGDFLQRGVNRTVNKAQHLATSGGGKANEKAFGPENSLLIAQALLGSDTDDVWTVVIAPNSALLAETVNCLSDPRVWRQVEGRVAMLDASDGRITSLPPEQLRFVATQPLSVSNIRLIAASWLSINSGAYVALTLALAIILAFATFNFVRNVGRREG